MKPHYKRYIKKYYRYLIDKGEIKAHNNSTVLKQQLKKIVSELNGMTKRMKLS